MKNKKIAHCGTVGTIYKFQKVWQLSNPNQLIFGGVHVAHRFSFFEFFCYVSLRSEFHAVITCYDFRIKPMFHLSFPPVVCRRAHVLFTLFMFVCLRWCSTHIVLCFCFVFLRLVCHVLPVSLDCPILIAPSVFSNVYLQFQNHLIIIYYY